MAITPFNVIQVTDFGTNRKLIYDFLLAINSNVHPILHLCTVSKLWPIISKCSLATGSLNLTPSLGVITCEYRHK